MGPWKIYIQLRFGDGRVVGDAGLGKWFSGNGLIWGFHWCELVGESSSNKVEGAVGDLVGFPGRAVGR